MEILTAFVRESSSIEPEASGPAKPSPDVQAALTVIGRRNWEDDTRPLDLSHTVNGAHLTRANLQNAALGGAELRNAELLRADLQGARASKKTIWPEAFDPTAADVEIVE